MKSFVTARKTDLPVLEAKKMAAICLQLSSTLVICSGAQVDWQITHLLHKKLMRSTEENFTLKARKNRYASI
jgi:hypothetical protein